MDVTLDQYAERVANDPRFQYQGDKGALIRHALSLFLMALAQSVKDQTPTIMFQMESLRRKQDEDTHREFIDYAGAEIEKARSFGKTSRGRLFCLLRLKEAARTSRAVLFLANHKEFRKLAQESGDEELQAWLEILS